MVDFLVTWLNAGFVGWALLIIFRFLTEGAIPGCSITQIKTDGLGAQFEHTVLITDTGYEILTV